MTITLIKDCLPVYIHKISRLVVHEKGDITVTEYHSLTNEFVMYEWEKGKDFDYIEVGDK